MSDVVTAAFENRIAYPEDRDGVEFYEKFLTENIDVFLHYFTSLGAESVAKLAYDTLPEAKSYQPDAKYRRAGYSYDRYDNMFSENSKALANVIGVTVGKRSSLLRLPVQRFAHAYELPQIWSGYPTISVDGVILNGPDQLFAFALNRLMNGKGLTLVAPVAINKAAIEPLFKSALDMCESPIEDSIDRDTFAIANRYLRGFELRVTARPFRRVVLDKDTGKPREVTYTVEGNSLERIAHLAETTNAILYAIVEVPNSVMQYVTQSERPVPRLAFQWFQAHYTKFISGQESEEPGPVQDLADIIKATANLREVRLTDSNDLTVSFDGEIRYLPSVTDRASYDRYVEMLDKNLVDTADGTSFDPGLKLMNAVREDGELDLEQAAPKNMVLYTDWRLNKLSYVTTVGTVAITDLNGYMPASTAVDLKLLDTDITQEATAAALADMPKILKMYGKSLGDFMEVADFVEMLPVKSRETLLASKTIEDAFRVIVSTGISDNWPQSPRDFSPHRFINEVRAALARALSLPEETYGRNSDRAFEYEKVMTKASFGAALEWPGLQCIKRAVDFIHSQVSGRYVDLMGTLGVQRVMTIAPFYSALARTDNLEERRAIDREERKIYREPTLDADYTPIPVPNIHNEVSLLPHQVKADNHLKNDPDNAVLAVQAGGGKTFLGLIDALRALEKGERVAIVCPNYLMKNYLEDGNFMTQGKLNIICIDNQVYNRYGEERLGQLIRKAPANTLCVIGLSVFSQGQNITYSYGGVPIMINQVVEFLRNQNWDRVIIDESHYLANPDSNRSRSVARFLSGVRKRREMTGTYINGTAVDALGQSRLLNPALLGTTEEFLETYAQATRGNKVTLWKPNSERHIFQRLKSGSDFINIRRKEWVALLPAREETFHFVTLSEEQQRVYMSILDQVIREIESDEKLAEKLKSGSEEDAEGLEAYLRRYLARIERYLACCELDELGSRMLKGADLVSPKSVKVNEILGEHFSNPETQNGKVIIFTSYRDSAKSIYDNLAPEFKRMALHYEAERKNELVPLMKKDDNIKIVIGVENSLNTGHNFQMFSRLIRIETVWNPGTLDQAESRLNRPDPKNKTAKRKSIHYDWICCNYTIDITKTGRLISKLLSAVKFDEQDNRLYNNLPDLPVVSMTIDNIRDNNDYETTLADYVEAYAMYQRAQRQDFADYLRTTKHQNPVPLPSGGVMEGSRFLSVPYIPGMVVPFQEELGLRNLGDVAMDRRISITELGTDDLKGLRVHTEFGDGVIVSVAKYAMKVKLDGSAEKVSVEKLSAFLIPDGFKGSVRDAVRRRVALDAADTTEVEERVIEERVEDTKRPDRRERKPVPNLDREANSRVELFINSINNNLAVNLDVGDPDVTGKLARRLDMTLIEPYYYAHIRTYRHLASVLEAITDAYTVPQTQIETIEALLEAFTEGKNRLFNVKQASIAEMRNFFLIRKKTVPRGQLYVYPLVEDGELYLCAWADQPSAKTLAVKARVPGVRWELGDGYYTRFFRRKSEAKEFIKGLADLGVTVTNLAEVREQYNEIRLVQS